MRKDVRPGTREGLLGCPVKLVLDYAGVLNTNVSELGDSVTVLRMKIMTGKQKGVFAKTKS